MSDIKLFRITNKKAIEVYGTASDLEKPLQNLIEQNLETLLGIRFLASEHSTGKTHGGRIDTLGLDENNCPVILEYKRSSSENVMTQGLYYMNWLMDHQAEFKLLVLEKYDKTTANAIDWNAPRLVCIASDFTKYDEHALQEMNRNIELIRYRYFDTDLLLFELVNAVSVSTKNKVSKTNAKTSSNRDKTITEWLEEIPSSIKDLFETLERYLYSLGDDVQRNDLQLYVAFKRLKNFVTVQFRKDKLLLYIRLDPSTVSLIEGFTRDARTYGHWGTGDLEINLTNQASLDQAKPLLMQAYEGGHRAK